MRCLSCMRGFINECRGGDCDTYTGTPAQQDSESSDDSEPGDDDEESASDSHTTNRRARRTKPDAALKDQQSTGRKRAARLYKLNPDADCEWLGKVRMGGGSDPITGCFDGKQKARHHGPDKNTLNNDPGNVHRICHSCHNRWHAANDPNYNPNKPLKD